MAEKLYLFARGSPTRGNNDDRRQWRKQGVVVGAAASKTQAKRCGCWEPHPGLVEQSETERFIPLYTKSARRIPAGRFWH